MAKSPGVGSCILLPLGDGMYGYVHFIGGGIHGDAVRVLPGVYHDRLTQEQVIALAAQPERFIVQTFVGSVIRVPEAEVVATIEGPTAWDIVPWWVSSPVSDRLKDRWVISVDRTTHLRMGDFLRDYPEIDPNALPGAVIVGEGVLQDMIRSNWEPAYGDFSKWVRK